MNTTEKLNKEYLDLYGDALKSVIELGNETPIERDSFLDFIKTFFAKIDAMDRTFTFQGREIYAKRKFTYSGRVIKTSYLHVWVQVGKHKDTCLHFREDGKGGWKSI